MQQRQLRLGDILDDYCPRERRVTNHAVVAMIGEDVKQTRCTTCDADHEYKHAKVPRQRRKNDSPAALYSQVLANGPKRVSHDDVATDGADHAAGEPGEPGDSVKAPADEVTVAPAAVDLDIEAGVDVPSGSPEPTLTAAPEDEEEGGDVDGNRAEEEGPVHRPLIRASLPRQDGQQPPPRPIPEFTIRQPGGRPNRFRPRHPGGSGPRGGQQFQGNRSNGNLPGGPPRGMRSSGGRPPQGPHGPMTTRPRRNGPGRKRSK